MNIQKKDQGSTATRLPFWEEVDTVVSDILATPVKKLKQFEGYGFKSAGQMIDADTFRHLPKKPRKSLKAFQQETVDFSRDLQKKDIIPLAVLPKKIFVGMCQKADTIYRFEHLDKRARTGGKLSGLNQADIASTRFEEDYYFYYLLSALAALFFFLGGFGLIPPNQQIELGLIFFAIGLFFSFSAIRIHRKEKKRAESMQKLQAEKERQEEIRRQEQRDQPEKLMKALFPKKVDRKHHKGQAIRINFGQAPDAFMEALGTIREAGLKPCIAADYRAIGIDSASLERALEAKREEDEDPILYVQNKDKSLIAVCGSYGNFPNEQAVLDWVKQEGLKLVFN